MMCYVSKQSDGVVLLSGTPESDSRALDQISHSAVKSGETQNSRQPVDQDNLPDSVESDEEFVPGKKKGRRVSAHVKLKPEVSPKTRYRRKRCTQCSGCLTPMCGVCESCKYVDSL